MELFRVVLFGKVEISRDWLTLSSTTPEITGFMEEKNRSAIKWLRITHLIQKLFVRQLNLPKAVWIATGASPVFVEVDRKGHDMYT